MNTSTLETPQLARVNGVALQRADETLLPQELRQRAYSELLRQAAVAQGLLSPQDRAEDDGVLSAAASAAVEALLDLQLALPEPSVEACQRHYAAHQARYASGERVNVRHILFAVTAGVDVTLLRGRAEACLLNVRCHNGQGGTDNFAQDAKTLSNCPSGAEGGQLGWLSASDCAPEFARELFGSQEVGVLARLLHSRFGLHVVEVLAREPGQIPAFESVHGAVAMALKQQSYATALRQYLAVLAGAARIEGVELEAADSPLVQA